MKSSQIVKNDPSKSSTISEMEIQAEKVLIYNKDSESLTSKEPKELHILFNVLKSTLHGEDDNANKLCEWQLPPNLEKDNCIPVNCKK